MRHYAVERCDGGKVNFLIGNRGLFVAVLDNDELQMYAVSFSRNGNEKKRLFLAIYRVCLWATTITNRMQLVPFFLVRQ